MSDFNRQNTSSSSTGTMGGTRNFDQFSDSYRSEWDTKYGKNKPWDEHRDAYRYGWESAQDSRYSKDFKDHESDLRSGYDSWRSQYGDKSDHSGHSMDAHKTMGGKVEHVWENFKDSVQEGWDRARMEFKR